MTAATLDDLTWPAPSAPAPARVLTGCLLAALACAVFIPVQGPGIGGLLAAMCVTAVLVLLARSSAWQWTPERMFWATTSLGLIAAGTVRASEWLFALCLLAGLGAASLAVAGGRTTLGLAVGVLAVPIAAMRSVPWAVRGIAGRPLGGGLLRTVLLSLLVLLVFGTLLVGADAAFADLADHAIPDLDGGRIAIFVLAGLGMLGACFLFATPLDMGSSTLGGPRRTVRRLEWAAPVGMLLALYVAFVGVQFAALFGGDAYVQRTAGLTYAEYARRGFWQLLAVTLLTLVVIGVAAKNAATDTPADRRWLRGLLGGLALLTLVIVASALTRMWAYQEAYGFTVLRLLVEACELWLGVVYVLVLAVGVRLDAGWLPRAVAGTGTSMLIALAALNPEGLIAERNVQRFAETGLIDVDYLSKLSADAVPALDALPEPARSCTLWRLAEEVRTPDGWREWNLSRTTARDLLAASAVQAPTYCPPD